MPMNAELSSLEADRLRTLQGYAILDTPPDADFDRFVRLAARQLKAPMAALTFVDADRVWFKAKTGLETSELPRALAFCSTTITQDRVCLVSDAQTDPRFAGSALVKAAPDLRFHAGVPLIAPSGHRIGALCVMDRQPREGLDPFDIEVLTELAGLAVTQLELRRERRRHEQAVQDLALINEVLTLLTDTRTLREAVEQIIGRVTAATGALVGTLLELRPDDGLVHLVTLQTHPGVAPGPFQAAHRMLPLPPSQISTADLFDATTDQPTRVRLVTPQPGFGVLTELALIGVVAIVGLSLPVGGRRHVLVLGFDDPGLELDRVAGLLAQLQQSLRPVLQRKLAEEHMTLLHASLSVTSDAVLITEADPIDLPGPRIVFANEGVTRLTGWSLAEVLGKTPRLLQTPETDPATLEQIRAALCAWRPVRAELLNRRRDGSLFWVELEITPLADAGGWFTHWVSVLRDVSERRRREREAQAAATRLARLTDDLLTAQRIARIGSWRWTPVRGSLEWSPETYAIFGVTPDSFTLTLEGVMALVHPEDRAETALRMQEMQHEGARVSFTFRTRGPDGVLRHCHCETACTRAVDGVTLEVTGFCQDVTERRAAEALLLQTERLNALGQLTGGIAHDFNNLLMVISLNLEIAADMIGEGHPALDMLDPAIHAAGAGARLTSSLLSFARRQPLLSLPTDVNQLVTEIAARTSRTMGARHSFRVVLQPDLPACLIDPAQFQSAVLNLLVNSRDAMAQGGEIVIQTGLRHLQPGQAALPPDLMPGSYVTIAVIDSGCGIPASLQASVFEPFFTTRPVGQGAGLGLSMAMGFARQSGGQIELASVEGQGTTVRIYLPVAMRELVASGNTAAMITEPSLSLDFSS
jgi:PAS domain S-box-containing protein